MEQAKRGRPCLRTDDEKLEKSRLKQRQYIARKRALSKAGGGEEREGSNEFTREIADWYLAVKKWF